MCGGGETAGRPTWTTDLDNLALLCRFHHHLVHDQNYHLRPDEHGRFIATRPDTTPIPAAGAPTHGCPDAVRTPGIDHRTITPRCAGAGNGSTSAT
jgi:hypothetical protein